MKKQLQILSVLSLAISPLSQAKLLEVKGPSHILYGERFHLKASLMDACANGGVVREYSNAIGWHMISLDCQATYASWNELESIGIYRVASPEPRTIQIRPRRRYSDIINPPQLVFGDEARLYALPYGLGTTHISGLYAHHEYQCRVGELPNCSEELLRAKAREAKLPGTIEIDLDYITGSDPGLTQGGGSGGGSGGYPSNTPSINGSTGSRPLPGGGGGSYPGDSPSINGSTGSSPLPGGGGGSYPGDSPSINGG